MKRMLALLLLVLMVASVTPAQAAYESYYLYPAISFIGNTTELPAGEMVGWTFDCTIFSKGIKIQDMIPTAGNVIDDDRHTARSFTRSEMVDICITFYVRAFLHLSTVYLWNGVLHVDEQTFKEIDDDGSSWVQYGCFDTLGDWSIGLYAARSNDTQDTDAGLLMLLALFGFSCCVVEKSSHWLARRRKDKE